MRKYGMVALTMGLLAMGLAACQPAGTQPSAASEKSSAPMLSPAKAIKHGDDSQGETALALLADKLAGISSDLASDAMSAPFGVAGVPDDYANDVETFAEMAHSSAQMLNASGGPADLACIYRGMAEDARATLSRLQSAKQKSDQVKDYNRMVALFQDVFAVQTGSQTHEWNGETCMAELPIPDKPMQSKPAVQDH